MKSMSSRAAQIASQAAWATRSGLRADSKGYVKSVNLNLRRPLSAHLITAFGEGSGNELKRKMLALHSSSALAVNFFEYWATTDSTALMKALDITDRAVAFNFEAQHETGLDGNPPNLDLCIRLATDRVIAIESKFTEWLSRKSTKKSPFKEKYFPTDRALWAIRGLPRCQRLAEDIQRQHEPFEHLDAPQLLKHALGLATQLGDRFELHYVYLDYPGTEQALHLEELGRFEKRVDAALSFRHYTYQQLFAKLQHSSCDPEYLEYLRRRYFVNAAQPALPADRPRAARSAGG